MIGFDAGDQAINRRLCYGTSHMEHGCVHETGSTGCYQSLVASCDASIQVDHVDDVPLSHHVSNGRKRFGAPHNVARSGVL